MTQRHRRTLCLVGLAKLSLGTAILAVGGLLLAFDLADRTTGLSLLSLGGAVGMGGHTLCQLCCFPGRPPQSPLSRQ